MIQKAMEQIQLRKDIVEVDYIDTMIDTLKKQLVNQVRTNIDHLYDIENDTENLAKMEGLLNEMKEEIKEAKGQEKNKLQSSIDNLSNLMLDKKMQIRQVTITSKNNTDFINYYQDMIEAFVSLKERLLSSNQ